MLSLLLFSLLFLISSESSLLSSFPYADGISDKNETCNSFENTFQGCSDDCSGIKVCLDNQTFVIDCLAQSYGRNQFCNQTSNLCQANPVQCTTHQIFKCPSINGFYPDPFNCRKYYQCYNGVDYEGNCTQGVFNPKIPGCKKGAICYNFSPINGLCRSKIGKFVVHPSDKNVYVYCGDFPIVLRCPEDNVFNLKNEICQFDCKAIGVFPDNDNYEWYYVCQKNGLQLEPYHFKCPDGLYFNEFFNGCVMY